ncbi:MAG: MGDG synthase family glycosyltransferase [Chthoniobacterales bacterium]
MAVARVLILTAGFGEGHNAAARNLRDALTAADPAVQVEMRDVFAEAYGWVTRLAVRAYLFVINRLPGVWNLVFQWMDRSSATADRIGVFGRAVRVLRGILDEFRPDVVVSVYPGCTHLLDHLSAKKNRTFRQIVIVTDSLTVNRLWHAGYADWYLVANEATAAVMRDHGVPAGIVRVSGFPVPAFFADWKEPKVAPAPGGSWRVLFMVNSGKHIAVEVVRELLKIEGIELSITVGRDEVLEQRIRAVVEESRSAASVHGWTKELPRLIASAHVVISKAGGATVQECLAAASPMIVSQVVPGQEEGNARLIDEAGAGKIAVTPAAISTAVGEAFRDGGTVWSRWHDAAIKLGRPNASREIAEWILSD